MSQEGKLNVSSTPSIPTSFVADIGTAVPVANILNVLGGTDIQTTGSGNTLTISFTGTPLFAETLTGNSGGAVAPTANNINTVGTGSITIVGNPGTSTLTTQLTGLTNHNVLVGAGTATITNVPPSTAGFVLTSNGAGADPSFQVVSASGAINSITGNTGGAEVPLTGNFNILGTGSITVVGSANTETVQLTGLTNHNVLVGAGTATITNVPPSTAGFVLVSNGASADPSFQTVSAAGAATHFNANIGSATPTAGTIVITGGTTGLTTTASSNVIDLTGTLIVANGGTSATSFNTNGVVISNTTTTGALAALSLTSGQVVIGGTTTPAAATLTAGTGVSIVNGNNSITINAVGSGLTWNTVTATSATMAVNNGYTANNAGLVTLTLPSTAAVGDTIVVVGLGAGGWSIVENTGQLIHVGSVTSTTTTGSVSSTNQYDTITLTCIVANTTWTARATMGNLTVV